MAARSAPMGARTVSGIVALVLGGMLLALCLASFFPHGELPLLLLVIGLGVVALAWLVVRLLWRRGHGGALGALWLVCASFFVVTLGWVDGGASWLVVGWSLVAGGLVTLFVLPFIYLRPSTVRALDK